MNRLTPLLTWCGLIPFLAAAVFTALNMPLTGLPAELVFISYSVVILCFMAGTLWGRTNHQQGSSQGFAIAMTNVWTLAAWLLLLLMIASGVGQGVMFLVLSLGYAHLYWLEIKHTQNTAGSDYLTLRKHITLAVIAVHLFMPFVANT